MLHTCYSSSYKYKKISQPSPIFCFCFSFVFCAFVETSATSRCIEVVADLTQLTCCSRPNTTNFLWLFIFFFIIYLTIISGVFIWYGIQCSTVQVQTTVSFLSNIPVAVQNPSLNEDYVSSKDHCATCSAKPL